MARNEMLKARCNEAEKQALLALARAEHRNPSEMLREVIREAAKKRGLWISEEVKE